MRAKWTSSGIAAVFLCLGFLPAWAAGSGGPEAVVQMYFSALKTGDIAGLTSVLSESFYNRRKVLLERNARYADFLMEMYKDMTINIKDVDINEGQALVTVEQISSGNDREDVVLILKQLEDGLWKIDQEQYR